MLRLFLGTLVIGLYFGAGGAAAAGLPAPAEPAALVAAAPGADWLVAEPLEEPHKVAACHFAPLTQPLVTTPVCHDLGLRRRWAPTARLRLQLLGRQNE